MEEKLEKIIYKSYKGGGFGKNTGLSEMEIRVEQDEVMLCLNGKCLTFSLYKMLMTPEFWQGLSKNCQWQEDKWRENSMDFHEKNLFERFPDAVDWLYEVAECK